MVFVLILGFVVVLFDGRGRDVRDGFGETGVMVSMVRVHSVALPLEFSTQGIQKGVHRGRLVVRAMRVGIPRKRSRWWWWGSGASRFGFGGIAKALVHVAQVLE